MIQILDFYVDEPACLGVPPYLSPYCRMVAGALVGNGISPDQVSYLTVDEWRDQKRELIEEPEVVIVIAGFTVPGKYLGGKIGTITELRAFLDFRQQYQSEGLTLVGGPVQFAPDSVLEDLAVRGGFIIKGDIEEAVSKLILPEQNRAFDLKRIKSKLDTGRFRSFRRDESQIDNWSADGAFITRQHPNFPYLINEVETYRGCTRLAKCSFCTEIFYGKPTFRSVEGVIREISELYQQGNRYFRLGRQADLLTYGADLTKYKSGFPEPNPYQVESLYAGIRDVAPDLKMLHLDNINPGTIATFPEASKAVLKAITKYNTAGDTAALGIESVDPLVGQINNLKCNRQDALLAVKIINEVGAQRENGVPKLLPGINLIHGLPGETDHTFQENFEFLEDLMRSGYMLRRINIRQVTVHQDTRLEQLVLKKQLHKEFKISKKRTKPGLLEKKFTYYKEKIRKEIDKPMLERVFPVGTVLSEVIPESENQGYVMGRQLGSYPVTVKIIKSDNTLSNWKEKRKPVSIVITGFRERSVLGLTHPIRVNKIGETALAQIPGVGKKRAIRIFLKQPVTSLEALGKAIDGPVWGDSQDYDFET